MYLTEVLNCLLDLHFKGEKLNNVKCLRDPNGGFFLTTKM
jgi:hypothetical protein